MATSLKAGRNRKRASFQRSDPEYDELIVRERFGILGPGAVA